MFRAPVGGACGKREGKSLFAIGSRLWAAIASGDVKISQHRCLTSTPPAGREQAWSCSSGPWAPPKFPEGLRTELLVVGAASGARLHRLHRAAPVGEELVP